MTGRTRAFVWGAVGVLVGGVAVGVYSYYSGATPRARVRGLPTELALVPANAEFVGYADIRAVMNSQVRARLMETGKMPQESGRHELEEKTGVDLGKDVDRCLVAMAPPADGDTASLRERGLRGTELLVTGRFDRAKIESLLAEHEAAKETYRGRTIFRGPRMLGHENGHEGALAFVQPGMVVMGDAAVVRRALDLQAGVGRSVLTNPTMLKRLEGFRPADTAWAVGRFDLISQTGRLNENVARQLPPVEWLAASSRIDGGLAAVVKAETRDQKSAENLRDLFRGFVALAKLQADSRPELATVLQTMDLEASGNTVSLSFSLPSKVIDALGQEFGGRGKPRDRAPVPPAPPKPPKPPLPPR